ncbi:MAG: NHL repeat-containing protein, partial [Candidatus Nitrosocosmicus sp.]
MMKNKTYLLFSLVVVSAFIMTSSLSVSASALQFAHKAMWGQKGVANGDFKQANGIAIDKQNNVYVNDFSGYTTKMVQKFTPDGAYILGFGAYGNGPDLFTNPASMTIDNKNDLFVADFGNPTYAIKEFTTNGTFIHSFGSFGLGPGQFINPGGVGTD